MDGIRWGSNQEFDTEFKEETVKDNLGVRVKCGIQPGKVKSGSLTLSERDMRLLKVILEQKFITRPQVIEYFFGQAKSYAEMRIRRLKKAGFLKAVKPFTLEPEIYLLGQEGYAALRYTKNDKVYLETDESVTLHPAKEIDFGSYEHDKTVNEVRFLLDKIEIGYNWVSEKTLRTLRGSSAKVPDGMCMINNNRVFVEVELNTKKAKTYEKIFNYYAERNDTHEFVLYVCSTQRLINRLIGVYEQTRAGEIYFILYEDLQESGEWAYLKTRSGDGGMMTLRDISGSPNKISRRY